MFKVNVVWLVYTLALANYLDLKDFSMTFVFIFEKELDKIARKNFSNKILYYLFFKLLTNNKNIILQVNTLMVGPDNLHNCKLICIVRDC